MSLMARIRKLTQTVDDACWSFRESEDRQREARRAPRTGQDTVIIWTPRMVSLRVPRCDDLYMFRPGSGTIRRCGLVGVCHYGCGL